MQDTAEYEFKAHERPTMPGSPANPDHPRRRRLFYFLIGILIGITGGLGNALIRDVVHIDIVGSANAPAVVSLLVLAEKSVR